MAIEYLSPGATAPDDYTLADDGAGPYIATWNRPEPQPTPEQIEAARHPAAVAIITERIKAERDRRKFEGVPVGEHRFHSDADSRTQQLGLVLMGANLPAVQWKTMGGAFVTMTPTLAQQIFGATAARDIAIFAVAESHIVGAAQAQDPLAYDLSTGWPA